jgi:hypothetical protein
MQERTDYVVTLDEMDLLKVCGIAFTSSLLACLLALYLSKRW